MVSDARMQVSCSDPSHLLCAVSASSGLQHARPLAMLKSVIAIRYMDLADGGIPGCICHSVGCFVACNSDM